MTTRPPGLEVVNWEAIDRITQTVSQMETRKNSHSIILLYTSPSTWPFVSPTSSATVLSSADDPSDGLLRGSRDAGGLPVEPDVLVAHRRPCAR